MTTTKNLIVAALAVGVSVGLGAAVGIGVAYSAPPIAAQTAGAAAGSQQARPYALNSRGQTYGTPASGVAEEPDLIQAIATNGNTGFVLSSDLNGPTPRGPNDAAAMAAASSARVIPVYLSDGISQIGVFQILPGRAAGK